MIGMSVFNSWDSTASQKGIEKATEKITGAIEKVEKTTGKLSTDIKQSSDKISAAVKDGTKDVADTIKRTATNNAGQTAPADAVSAGLTIPSIYPDEIAAAGWLGSKFCGGDSGGTTQTFHVGNSFGRVVGSYHEL